MNLFMPYPSIAESIKSLDNVRLNKQILECYQIIRVSLGETQGYKNHPIVKYYSQYPAFVDRYGWICCVEYNFRTNKHHKYEDYFYKIDWPKPVYPPRLYAAEYSKDDPRCIRTYATREVTKLYQQKLINKWVHDSEVGRPPKWTNRKVPEFYVKSKEFVKLKES